MKIKIFGIVATAAIVAVIALALINIGNYHSLLPERPTKVEQSDSIEQNEPITDSTTQQTIEEMTSEIATEQTEKLTEKQAATHVAEPTEEPIAIDVIPELSTDKIRVVVPATESASEASKPSEAAANENE